MPSSNATLSRRFFARPADVVARALLGTRLRHGRRHGIVVETEAYLGPQDLASHARFASSKRNRVMFEAGGTSYVYLCYGIHQLFNVVTGRPGEPQAVLIRALADPQDSSSQAMSGPGKLSAALRINKTHNGIDLTATRAPITFDRARRYSDDKIAITPRIGVDYAGQWAEAPLRFCLANHAAVSGR